MGIVTWLSLFNEYPAILNYPKRVSNFTVMLSRILIGLKSITSLRKQNAFFDRVASFHRATN